MTVHAAGDTVSLWRAWQGWWLPGYPITDWGAFLTGELEGDEWERLQAHERTGRPLGSATFLERLESTLGRKVTRQKSGPKPKKQSN